MGTFREIVQALERQATRLHPVLVAIGLVAALCACGLGGNKVQECNSLIGAMNKGADNVRKARAAGDTNVADLEKMATTMEELADSITKLKLSNADLRKKADDYATNARALAKSARDMAAAVRTKDIAKMTVAKGAIDKAVAAEAPIVNDINAFCQGK